MAEKSWEEHAHRRTGIWKWFLILLPVVLAAGISIYNNRDVIYDVVGFRGAGDSSAAFVVSGGDTPSVMEPLPQMDKPSRAAPRALQTAPASRNDTVALRKNPAAKTIRAPAAAPRDTEPAIRTGQPLPNGRAGDSVTIGEIPCRVLDRDDVVVLVVLSVYCDRKARQHVLQQRDAIGVLVQNAIRFRDLEMVKPDALKPELLGAINRLFDAKTVTGISFRSVRIEKVSSE